MHPPLIFSEAYVEQALVLVGEPVPVPSADEKILSKTDNSTLRLLGKADAK